MDVAYYLSELLGQLGEVNVPGLGYFVQLRLDGYYNDDEGTFYPPRHQVHYDPQFLDDDVFAQYIAEKKHISLASSKYFTAKFLNNLVQEAMVKEVALADLGWLYFDRRLSFRAAEVMTNDPAFYGLEPVAISKLGGTSVFDQIASVTYTPRPPLPEYLPQPEAGEAPSVPVLKDEPVTQPGVFTPRPEEAPEPEPEETTYATTPEDILTPEPETITPPQEAPAPEPEETYTPQPEVHTPPPIAYTPPPKIYTLAPEVFSNEPENEEQEEFIFRGKSYSGGDDEEEGTKRRPLIWLGLVAAILVIALLGLAALYKFKPAAFHRLMGAKPAPISLKVLPKNDTVKHDTTKKIAPAVKTDTIKPAAVIDDTTDKTETVATTGPIDTLAQIRFEISGGMFSTKKEAENSIRNYKKLGIDARILQNVPGRHFHLTLGTYFTRKDAIIHENALLKTGKVSASTIGIQPYYPSKK